MWVIDYAFSAVMKLKVGIAYILNGLSPIGYGKWYCANVYFIEMECAGMMSWNALLRLSKTGVGCFVQTNLECKNLFSLDW